MAKLFANSGDPDQMPHSAVSDLGLHCLPITLCQLHLVKILIRLCKCAGWSESSLGCISAGSFLILQLILTFVMLNNLRCHAHFLFLANHITWSRLLIYIHILNDKQCRSRSVSSSEANWSRSTLLAKSGYISTYVCKQWRPWPESLGMHAGLGLCGYTFRFIQLNIIVQISDAYNSHTNSQEDTVFNYEK